MSVGDSKTFPDVKKEVFDCVKANSKTEHNTDYIPLAAYKGEAVTQVKGKPLVLEFDFDPRTNTIKYTIKEQPWFVRPTSLIWSGIQKAIDKCRK
jgi:translation elongation factor EF-1alpha